MIAQYNDKCRGCGGRISIGDEIHWTPDYGPTCEVCGPTGEAEGGGGPGATMLEGAPGYVRVLAERIKRNESRIASLQMAVARQKQDIDTLATWAKGISTDLDIAPPEMSE